MMVMTAPKRRYLRDCSDMIYLRQGKPKRPRISARINLSTTLHHVI
jgi:hypothetical protein